MENLKLVADVAEALIALPEAINKLADAINKANGVTNTATSSTSSSTSNDATKSGSDESSAEIAKKKTYVFFRDNKSGCIVEKGDEIPQDNGATNVSKANWEKLCEKHGLDVKTGEPKPTDDLDDLDDLDMEEGESKPRKTMGEELEEESDLGDDLDDDLGDSLGDDLDDELGDGLDDDEPEVTLDDVKAVAKPLMSKNREAVLGALKKVGSKNFADLKPENYAEVLKLLKKA